MKLIRQLFAKCSSCPCCGCGQYKPNGRSRSGGQRYRKCTKCGTTYPVNSIAAEYQDGVKTIIKTH